MKKEVFFQSEDGNRCEEWVVGNKTGFGCCCRGSRNPDYVGADEIATSGPG